MPLFKSFFTVSFCTLISRILGYIRDIFFANLFGASTVSDIFFVAFRLPNLFRKFYAEGAFNAAFIPIFSKELESKGKNNAILFAEESFSLMLCILIIFTFITCFFMNDIIKFFAPGFLSHPEKFEKTVFFARIMFPYLIFISLISLMSGVLNSFNRFVASALVPALLNITLILGLIINIYITKKPLYTLSFTIILGGIAQFALLSISLHINNIKINIRRPKITNNIKELFKKILPGIISSSATQISTWINTIFSTTIANAVSFLYYADRIIYFPLAIIGTAIGTALLPVISKKIQSNQNKEAISLANKALEISLILAIPSSVALIAIPDLITSLIFKHGAFGANEVANTSKAISIYAFGLPAFTMIKIFSPIFFAKGDTKTPVKIAILCLIISTLITISLIQIIGFTAIAVSTSISSWINNILLITIAIRQKIFSFNKDIYKKVLCIIFASTIMYALIYVLKTNLYKYTSSELLISLIIIISSVISYFAVLLSVNYDIKSTIYT